jgi:hypothetical protein
VSIDGKVDNTLLDGRPAEYGVQSFGSNVSVCAMPPAIQRMISLSAVAAGAAVTASTEANARFGNPAASAESVAALAVFRKSRLFHVLFMR